MINLQAITNGQTFNLSDNVQFGWIDYAALGLPPIQNITEQGPLQHGVTWLDFRLGPRLVPFTLDINSVDIASQYSLRAQLLDIFAPGLPVKLVLTYDPSNTRQLDCYVNGGLSYDFAQTSGFEIIVPVELIAPDPCWYDPTPGYLGFSLGGGGSTMTIPLSVPHMVGASTIDLSQSINYPGNWNSFPIITITGPITNPVLQNTLTGEKLDFTGTTIAAGHYFAIDCRYGYKTITDDTGASQIAALVSASSNLATFHIERRKAGQTSLANPIRITGTSANLATRVDISYFNRYTGA